MNNEDSSFLEYLSFYANMNFVYELSYKIMKDFTVRRACKVFLYYNYSRNKASA